MDVCGQIQQDILVILRKLCPQNEAEFLEAKACPDQIRLLVSIPPKYIVLQIMDERILCGSAAFFPVSGREPGPAARDAEDPQTMCKSREWGSPHNRLVQNSKDSCRYKCLHNETLAAPAGTGG